MTFSRAIMALLLISGCALLSKGTPANVRYFTPEHAPQATAPSPATGMQLRLGRVTAGTDLGERIMYGDGKYQVSFYETRRWTEPPEKYVRDTLEHTLFDEAGFLHAVEGQAPTLNIEILSFMEVRNGQSHLARVALRGVLSTNVELFAETFAVDQPVQGLLFEDVVAAVSHALDLACRQVAARAANTLAGRAAVGLR
jgi:cholesterol transport system auxiliary component